MAEAKQQDSSGTVVQSWMPADLARDLKKQADAERRSVSAVVRIAVEDKLGGKRGGSR
jgi:hypothetical protein